MPSLPKRRASDSSNNKDRVSLYVTAVVILAITTMAAVLLVILLQPANSVTLITAITAISAPIILTFMTLTQQENHRATNSRMDQLVESRTEIAETRGVLRGAALPVSSEQAATILDATTGPGATGVPTVTDNCPE